MDDEILFYYEFMGLEYDDEMFVFLRGLFYGDFMLEDGELIVVFQISWFYKKFVCYVMVFFLILFYSKLVVSDCIQ